MIFLRIKKAFRKSKAFTLIELLAVIIILAVILIIAVPAIGKIINKSREDSIKADIKMMENAARTYVSKTGEYTPDENETEIIPLKVLIKKEYISKIIYPDGSKNECDGAVKVTKENKKYVYEGYLNCGIYLSDNINEIYEELEKKVEEKVIEVIKENEELLPDDNDTVTYDIEEDLDLDIEDPMDPDNNEVTGEVEVNHGTEITGEGTTVEIDGETYEVVADIDVKDENGGYVYLDGEVIGKDEEEEEPTTPPNKYIAMGSNHTIYAVGNKIYTFGRNDYGQLGNGEMVDEPHPTPVQVTLSDNEPVKKILAGGNTSIVLTSSGKVYTWGNNDYGQLGNGNKSDSSTPFLVTISGETIKDILMGRSNTVFAFTESGKIYAWGNNSDGQLGTGTSYTSITTPTEIINFSGPIKKIASGSNHSIFITEDGELYTVGRNNYCQIGDGTTQTPKRSPILITIEGEIIKDIAAGNYHNLIVTENGNVYAWGYNNSGQIGDGGTNNQCVPIKINIPNDEKVKKVIAGGNFSLAVTENGNAYGWGINTSGQLGIGNTTSQKTPVQVVPVEGETVIDAIAGGSSSAVYTASGKIYTFGSNSYGQLGDKTTENRHVPTLVTIP